MHVARRKFYDPVRIFHDVEKKAKDARQNGELIDYLSFVPDGEPTLDRNLGQEIRHLRTLGPRLAVITNASLLWRKNVRRDLSEADWVSLKIDALGQDVWRRVNRPHGSLELTQILEGILDFGHDYEGELTTETMLVQGINDHQEEIERISDFIVKIKPTKSYIAIPIRPPAEKWVRPPTEFSINMAFQVFSRKSLPVEYLIGYEGNAFAFTGHVEEDLLSITAVHPMREEAVREFLQKAGAGWGLVDQLIDDDKLVEVQYEGNIYFMIKLDNRSHMVSRP